MSLIAIICALALDYYLPPTGLAQPKFKLKNWIITTAQKIEHSSKLSLPAFQQISIWLLLALLPSVLLGAFFYYCHYILPFIGLMFNIAVLYIIINFNLPLANQAHIAVALRVGNLSLARLQYRQWLRSSTLNESEDQIADYNATDIASHSIAHSLLSAHNQWVAPLFWFVISSACGVGVAGFALYHLSKLLAINTHSNKVIQTTFSQKIFTYLNTPTTYLCAWGFAIAGDFEDALYNWREQISTWKNNKLQGVILTMGAGALGVKLGDGIDVAHRSIGNGDEADADYLHSCIGLIWRTSILMLSLLLLLTIAYWLGN